MNEPTRTPEALVRDSDAKPTLLGILCGLGAALCWALGFVATRHGLRVGFAPADLLMHRFLWSGLAFLPFVLRAGFGNLCGIGWSRGMVLMVLGGPVMPIISYIGFLFVPLGHGSVIQPSCATLGGLFFATALLKERISLSRFFGAVVIVGELGVIGSESIGHIGTNGVKGDLIFVPTGFMFAGFGALLRYWRVSALSAAAVINVLSLSLFPAYAASGGLGRVAAIGLGENVLQAVAQGVLAGPAAMYLFVFSIQRLGVARADLVSQVADMLVEIDEVDCPHCHGRGLTGLVGDFCRYCRGSFFISTAKAEAYDPFIAGCRRRRFRRPRRVTASNTCLPEPSRIELDHMPESFC